MNRHIDNVIWRFALCSILLIAGLGKGIPARGATYSAYFRNDPGWSNVSTWIWDNGNNVKNYTGDVWPGAACFQKDVNGETLWYYSFSTDDELIEPMIIFNEGFEGGSQTADLGFVNNGVYDFNGFTGEVIEPAGFNGTVEVVPNPSTNLVGTENADGTAIQPLERLDAGEYGVSFSFDTGSGSTVPAFYRNGSNIRLYRGNVFKMELAAGIVVTRVEFIMSGTAANETTLSASSGEVSYDKATNIYTWTNTDNKSENVTFNVSNTQFRFTKLLLTFDESFASRPAAPVFSQNSCEFFQPFELTMTDINEPAATIYYTLDGSTPSADNGMMYTAPVTISTGGDVTVSAVSVNENGVSPVKIAKYHFVAKHLFSAKFLNKSSVHYLYYSSNTGYNEWTSDNFAYITDGEYVDVSFALNDGYVLKGVTLGGNPLEGTSFSFNMPAYDIELVVDAEFNPASPSDPQPGDTAKKYNLTLVANPSGAAVLSGAGTYKEGQNVAVGENYRDSGYVLTGWTLDGKTVSTNSNFYYTMPGSDVVLVANYVYNPSNPSDPQQPTLKHPLTVIASPAGAGTFITSGSEVTFGEEYYVYAYPHEGYKFKGWIVNGVAQEDTSTRYTGVMTDAGAQVVGLFTFDPGSPSNPGANYYNPATGQVIIDDFTQGRLYSALNSLVGSADYANVSSIIVKGRMDDGDYGTLRSLTNAVTIDLSRTGGVTSVPSYAFENLAAGNILLSPAVTGIGGYAFNNCKNLISLTVYAQEPPKCTSSTFSGLVKENCTVFVPASAMELYTTAEYWKDFTILPITDDAHVLQVNLPADASDGRYKSNSIELVNLNSGVRQKYVVSDRLLYTFNGLRKDEQYNIYMLSQAGLELGRIENVTVPDNDFEVTFDNLKSVYSVNAVVTTPDGKDVTSDVTVEWLKPLADGTATYLRKAISLGEVPEGQLLVCRITLNSQLGTVYAAPGDLEYTVDASNNTCTVNLTPIRSITLTGTVVDGDGAGLAGASVSVNQTLNGRFSKSYTARTDSKGQWSLSVLDAPETRLTYAASECVNVNDTIGAFETGVTSLDLGKMTLRSIVGARVSYGFTYRAAGAETVEDHYSDYQNVAVSVFNVTQNRAHAEVSLQYPVIAVLDENIDAGDELKLTATSRTGAFNPIEKTVTVDENQRAEVTFDIIGKGGIAASFGMTDNPAVIAMLYSSTGELLKKLTYTEAQARFTELEDGDYTLISMGQSDLMNSILRLANFAEIGLTEGKDYVKNTVTVESGKLTAVSNSEIPAFDESLFYYTGSSTGFSTNKSSITTGNYLTLRSVIDFKGVYKNDISNVALVVDLPDACDFVEQSVIQGPNQLPYTLDNNRLTVQLGDNYSTLVRFCAIPTAGGTFNATASIVFDYNGKTLTQPIGSAIASVKDLEISVPKITSKTIFHVTGVSFARSDVKVYDNGSLLSVGKSNAVGSWDVECNLFEPENLSEHNIYAEITTPTGLKLVSETKTLVYDESCVEVIAVTMINTAHPATSLNLCDYVTVFDFQNPKKPDTYWYWPSYPRFTFLIDLSYHDKQLIPFVWLHVFTSDGNVRSLRADYDEKKDCWIAIDDFHSSALPTRVSVTVEDMRYDLADEATYNTLIDDYVGDIKVKDTVEEDGKSTTTYIDEQGEDIASITSYESTLTDEELIEQFKNEGFEEDENLDDESDYIPADDEDALDDEVKVMTKPDGQAMVMISKSRVAIIRIIREEDKKTSTSLISSTIVNQWKSFFNTYFDEKTCSQIIQYKKYYEHLDKYVTVITSSLVAHRIFVDYRLLPPGTKIPKKQVLAKLRRVRHSSKRWTSWTMEYSVLPKSCPPPTPPIPPTPPTPECDHVMDPSGFVYEAVPANRVEGVQATIYYKETKEDMYGDPYENIVLWDAEEYAQQNPLFTDENGMYRWDVPQGLWQVKFEKDGYVTAYSEWLPVPPPQLDVNISITQNKQPEVTEARAYEEGVEVQFDKFMDLSTLTTDNIYVTANGEKLAGEVRLIDSALADEFADEADADATRYASRVRFIPEQPLSVTTGEIRVTVSRNVLSYAGIPMTETFSQVLDVEKEVQVITADDVKVLYGGEKVVTVYAVPYEAAVGRTLRIANSSDLIASIDKTEAVIDAEGKATVTVKGDLPGRAQLSFSIDDVTVTGECAVDVVTEIINAEAPKSSRASGTAVYRGTKVELTTESKDGVIYFTTDGSCPCDENGTRRKYTVPIIINDDTQILAMTSVGTGADDVSETVEFNYTLKHSDMDFAMDEGWTWISHNFETPVSAETLAADENVHRIMSQTREVIRDPQLGLIGTLQELSATESYKVETTSATARQRLSDVAWNPATPIALGAGWNWLGYPVGQTMSVDEAFAPTDAENHDVIVGQNGFAQFDGEKWVGTLETLSPGLGYMYQSQSPKNVVYNTSIVSTASARYAAGISGVTPLVLDIHKYPSVMPVIATLSNLEGMALDNSDYHVNAFCGTECRGIGRVVNGLVMMNVYGKAGDRITFQVVDKDGSKQFANNASLSFSENIAGGLDEPYVIPVNVISGISDVTYDGNIKVSIVGDMLVIKGIAAGDIDLVEVYNINGHKLIHETDVPETGIRVSHLNKGAYVVIVNGNGEYSYHKVALR